MLDAPEELRARAANLHLAAEKLERSGEGHARRAAAAVDRAGGTTGYMQAPDYERYFRDARQAAREFDTALSLREAQRRALSDAKVLADRDRTYRPDGEHSYFRDTAIAVVPDHPEGEEARERLRRYRHELDWAVRDRTAEGEHLRAVLRDACRTADPDQHRRAFEQRTGVTSALASAGAFAAPYYLVSMWAPFLERKPFARECSREPLPPWGMTVSLPAFTGDAAASLQAEGTAIPETDPSSSTSGALGAGPTAQVSTVAGVVTVSQQLLDRSSDSQPSGSRFDTYVYRQLSLDCDRQLDLLALNSALAGAGQVTYTDTAFTLAGSGGTGHFVAALSAAKNVIEGTPGAYLEPSHIFMVPQRWELIAGWADSQGRPIILPAAADSDDDGSKPGAHYGDSTMTWGGLRVIVDPYIPTPATGADQVLVCDTREVIVFTGPRLAQCFVEPGAAALTVTLRTYQYAACLVRYPTAVQSISGTGMTAVTL